VRTVYLSYPLSGTTPAYGGGESLTAESVRSIEGGDTANTARWTLSNHLGTHIDFPRHFVREGKCLDDYPATFFAFGRPAVVDVSGLMPGAAIGPEVFEGALLDTDTDMIIVLTGFWRLRSTRDYWEKNPVFAPGIADVIRRRFPIARVFGFDSISLSSWTDRETGRKAHGSFLDHESPILPLEDMDLSPLAPASRIKRLTVYPLRVAGADAAPVTVVAELEP
jgi:arylformamidase